MIVTIDGPAGSGKSSAATALAGRLGFEYLDTGAMYRAVAFGLMRAEIAFDDWADVTHYLESSTLEMPAGQVILNGDDVSDLIRTPAMGNGASAVAVKKNVRDVLVKWQRQIARGRDFVCEGRDQGTVVFPESLCKFYVTAGIHTRSARRYAEYAEKKIEKSFEDVIREIVLRDHQDSTRDVAPLVCPDDAIVVWTDTMTRSQVVDRMEREVNRCRPG
jgi:CMP/dCMP kinase